MQSNAKTIGTKAMGFAEANVRSAFDLAQKLVRAKDLQEVLALQSDYAKTQMTTIQEQAKELGSIVQTTAQGVVAVGVGLGQDRHRQGDEPDPGLIPPERPERRPPGRRFRPRPGGPPPRRREP